ncbi:MAG: diguanylate cyclase [Deltaproteobacteria bacterium]|nr:diguanylate cyclase [Deltaproteobacteria bacterium]
MKFTLVLFVIGVIPIATASFFFYISTEDALFNNVFKELKWTADEIDVRIDNHFRETRKNLIVSAQNTAFKMYYLEPDKKTHWLKQQNTALSQLRKIYRDRLDEACYIDASGQEISRIIFDTIAKEKELSSGEHRTTFFKKSFEIEEGTVFQGKPTISEDTDRWVIPNATPIVAGGKKVAILHFEINLYYFQRLLKSLVNPDRGYAFIVNEKGELIAHTKKDIKETGEFEPAFDKNSPPGLQRIANKMMRGESGIEEFSENNKKFYLISKLLKTAGSDGINENIWTLGYVIPAENIYVEYSILKYNLLSFPILSFIVIATAYIVGGYITRPVRELAHATNSLAAGEMPHIAVRGTDEISRLASSFNMMVEAVKKRDEALKALAITDGLTGLYNHRHFKTELEKALKRAERFKRPFSLLLADIDHFKLYNDTYGHPEGDTALKAVAKVCSAGAREVDIAARYGGEEFVLILTETSHEDALVVAERLRKKVEDENIPFEAETRGRITLSIGVASFPANGFDMASLITKADKALYKAKAGGRNMVVSAESL